MDQTQETRDESPVHEPAHGTLAEEPRLKTAGSVRSWKNPSHIFSRSSRKSDSFNHFELNVDDACKVNGLFIEIINDYLCLFIYINASHKAPQQFPNVANLLSVWR